MRHFIDYFHEHKHHMGRGPRGGFPFGGFPFGGGPGHDFSRFGSPEDLRRGRKFSADDLQLLLLSLLEQRSSHGYELIKALDERSGGFYSPSPGMVYPALTYLEELGHLDVQAEGNRKSYSLNDSGRAFLTDHRQRADALLSSLEHAARRMDAFRRVSRDETSPDAASHADGDWLHEVTAAKQALEAAIERYRGSSPREQFGVAAILMRAVEKLEERHGRRR